MAITVKRRNFRQDVVADQINVWLEENSTDVHRDVAVKAGGDAPSRRGKNSGKA